MGAWTRQAWKQGPSGVSEGKALGVLFNGGVQGPSGLSESRRGLKSLEESGHLSLVLAAAGGFCLAVVRGAPLRRGEGHQPSGA